MAGCLYDVMGVRMAKVIPGYIYQTNGQDIEGVHKIKRLIADGKKICFVVEGIQRLFDLKKHDFRQVADP